MIGCTSSYNLFRITAAPLRLLFDNAAIQQQEQVGRGFFNQAPETTPFELRGVFLRVAGKNLSGQLYNRNSYEHTLPSKAAYQDH